MSEEDSTLIPVDFRAVRAEAVLVPYTELSAEALRGVVEGFVLREGTDYGAREVSHEAKIGHVMAQLQAGEAQIWFDPDTSSVDILRTDGRGR
jgi:uncharacterized protein YheU (UPF0270 family)